MAFRDPEGVKVVGISEGKAEVIDYANTPLVAIRFTVTIRSRSEEGGYGRPRAYQ